MSFWDRVTGKSSGASVGGAMSAPVVVDPYARGFDSEFRLADDPGYVIRINQRHPKGLPRKIAEFVAVAGIMRPEPLANACAFISGAHRRIELLRVLDNPVDPNAIAVYGRWSAGEVEKAGRLGFLPSDVSSEIARNLGDSAIGATLKVMYARIAGRSPGLRLDVWAPRRQVVRPAERAHRPDWQVPSDSVERNLRGIQLEAEGLVDNAIECYEANIRDGFDGNHPYDRLAVIFRRRRDADGEIRVLRRAVEVLERLESSPRSDIAPKLEKFRQGLRRVLERSEK